MNLTDVNARLGPYWKAYQETRKRDKIMHDPDHVPTWFLTKLLEERLAAAQYALRIRDKELVEDVVERRAVWNSLRVLIDFIRYAEYSAIDSSGDRAQVLAALLGATEVEMERERVQYGFGPNPLTRLPSTPVYEIRDSVDLAPVVPESPPLRIGSFS